jgi:hypothetical protein
VDAERDQDDNDQEHDREHRAAGLDRLIARRPAASPRGTALAGAARGNARLGPRLVRLVEERQEIAPLRACEGRSMTGGTAGWLVRNLTCTLG